MSLSTDKMSHAQARSAHWIRLQGAIESGPWTERAVEIGRTLLGDAEADPVTAALAAAGAYRSSRRSGTLWDALWETASLTDGTPRWSNAIAFADGCRLGLDHGLELRDMALDLAQVDAVVDFGAGTGSSLLPWVGAVDSLVAVEPAPHFRTFGEAILPEARWFSSAEDATAVEGRVVVMSLVHVMNTAGLWQDDLAAAVGLVADAEEILVATASNSVRSSRIFRAERWLQEALRSRGFEWVWPRSTATLGAGWGTHELEVTRWVRP